MDNAFTGSRQGPAPLSLRVSGSGQGQEELRGGRRKRD